MRNYLDLLEDILHNGEKTEDRTGVGTLSVFGRQLRFNLADGFPAVTTKRLAWKAVKSELLWFLEGDTDERRLAEILHGSRDTERSTIWTGNATAPYWEPRAKFPGDMGRIYQAQWRHWRKYTEGPDGAISVSEVDQIKNLIDGLKNDPTSRRHILQAWNPGELDQMALPPCHVMSQYKVDASGRLSCLMTQRSADVPIGIPFNIASYALLTHMLAQVCGYEPGELIISMGDCHIYLDQIEQVKEQLTREPYPLPKLWLNPNIIEIDDFRMENIELDGYQCHSAIKMPMAV